MIKGIDHIGLMVADLEQAIKDYEQIGFKTDVRFEKENPKAKAARLSMGGAGIELWQFEDESHGVAQRISNHLALESTDLESDLKSFLNKGFKLTIPITDAVSAKRCAYVEDADKNSIELIEL